MPIVEGLEYFLLSEIFQFKPNCKLKRFIEKYTDTEVHSFTILQIIDKLNHITKVQNMYDENNQSIIRCTPELEEAINFKGLHSLELLSAIIEHITQDLRPSFQRNYANFNYRISSSAQIDTEERITQNQNIMDARMARTKYFLQSNLQELLGLQNQKYTMIEIMEALTRYLTYSATVVIDERNPRIAFIEDDPLKEIFNMNALHTSQKQHIIAHFMKTDMQLQTAFDQYQEIFIEESMQFMSHIYLTANATASLINNGQLQERTNCLHFIEEEYIEDNPPEYEIPSAEESVRPEQAMGRTQQLSSADNTDTDDQSVNQIYRQAPTDELYNGSQDSNGRNRPDMSNNSKRSYNEISSSTSKENNDGPKSIKFIFSTIKTAELLRDITTDITFPEKERINISIRVLQNTDATPSYYLDTKTTHTLISEQMNEGGKTITCEAVNEIRLSFLATINETISEINKKKRISTNCNHHKQSISNLQSKCFTEGTKKLQEFKETLLRWNSENNHVLKNIKCLIDNDPNDNTTDANPITAKPISCLSTKISIEDKEIQEGPNDTNQKDVQVKDSFYHEQRCISCKKGINTNLPRCIECWNIRKQWIPERPRKRRKLNDKDDVRKDETTHECKIITADQTPKASTHEIAQTESEAHPDDTCWCCCSRKRNALIIHGKQGHRILCYPCAKKTWKSRAECPVCKRKIEKIVKIINV